MPRLIWTPAALLDLQRLYRLLAEKNVGAAKRGVQAIREGMTVITKQPGIGRPVEDMEPEFREWLIDFGESGYVVLYRYAGENAVVLAVRHQREMGY
jgi:plasmid stabilization system protein ParE